MQEVPENTKGGLPTSSNYDDGQETHKPITRTLSSTKTFNTQDP